MEIGGGMSAFAATALPGAGLDVRSWRKDAAAALKEAPFSPFSDLRSSTQGAYFYIKRVALDFVLSS